MFSTLSVRSDGVRSWTHAGAVPVVVMVLGLVVLAGGLPRRCEAGSDDLSGRVVDQAGAGVSEAQVWAIGGRWEEPQTVTKAMTDEQGRFVLSRAWGGGGPASLHYLRLFARARDGRIGWQATVWRNSPDVNDVRIEVGPVGEVRGRVIDQHGRPITGAEVTPVLMVRSSDPNSSQDYIQLSPELAGPLRTTTAADGTFGIKEIPPGAQLQATVAAPGFGKPRISWDTTKPVTIVLDGRLGQIQGRLRPPDPRGLSGQLSVSLRSVVSQDQPAPGSFRVLYFQTIPAGKDGSFQFRDLPPGRYAVNVEAGPSTPFAAQPVKEFEVGPGAVAQLEIPLQRLLTITGRVIDAQTGKGIAGITVLCWAIENQQFTHQAGRAETDAEGRYTVPARPGTAQVLSEPVPKMYLGLRTSESPKLEVKADRTWPDLKLARAMELDGVVVDAAGQPVAGAEVFVLAPGPQGFASDTAPTRTGPGGRFHLEQLDPDDTLPLWARTKEATTDGAVVIRPKEVQGQLRLTIDPKYAFRIRGMVTDRSGQRLTGAKVTLSWSRRYVSERPDMQGTGIGSGLESYTTSEAGWFVFRDLWPGHQYKVTVEAKGHSKAETPEVTGRAGATHDFGKIALLNVSGHLAGRVVGSDGRPIVNATVFNRGDGPAPVSSHTDAQGRFRLDGLFPGVKYAFIRQDGYRFTGVRADGDADDLAVTLLKPTEPPPAWKPGPTASYEDQRAFAKSVLTRLWEKYGEKANQNGAFVCILDMARIDPELAMQWSAQDGHRYDGRVRQAAAEELAESDARGALDLLTQDRDRGTQYTVQQLAERFAPTDRAKALVFAEEAAVRARALDQPDRSTALAAAGAVLARLGRAEAGRKLIDEAVETAARLGTDNRQAYYRGLVAQALAPFDLKRALALVEPCKDPNDHERYHAFVAGAIAATDTKRAVALADAMRGNSTLPDLLKTYIAAQIGADRPDEAVKIIEGMKSYAADKMRAEAFAWLAVAIASRDRSRAFALIDRAMALPVDRTELFDSWTYFGAATAPAARMAACARQVGYPDMDSVIMRVMTTRPAGSRGGFHDPAMQILSATIAAVPLALVDPGAARTMLQQIEERSGLDPPALAKVAGDDWLRAWALVDLKKAEALVEAELAALDRAKNPDLQRTGLFRMVELLATPPQRREAVVLGDSGGVWHPGISW